MIQTLYCYNDLSVGFGTPFIQTNEKVATREFIDRAQNTGRQVLNDIELWQLGTMNDETGEITMDKKLVMKGASIVKESEITDGM